MRLSSSSVAPRWLRGAGDTDKQKSDVDDDEDAHENEQLSHETKESFAANVRARESWRGPLHPRLIPFGNV